VEPVWLLDAWQIGHPEAVQCAATVPLGWLVGCPVLGNLSGLGELSERSAMRDQYSQGRPIAHAIDAFSAHYESALAHELSRARRMLAAGGSPDAVLEALSRRLTNKVLHPPLAALNAAGGDVERAALVTALSRLYRIDVEVKDMSDQV
jgi:hypothetical protein